MVFHDPRLRQWSCRPFIKCFMMACWEVYEEPAPADCHNPTAVILSVRAGNPGAYRCAKITWVQRTMENPVLPSDFQDISELGIPWDTPFCQLFLHKIDAFQGSPVWRQVAMTCNDIICAWGWYLFQTNIFCSLNLLKDRESKAIPKSPRFH